MLIPLGFLSVGSVGWISHLGTINVSDARNRSSALDSDKNLYTAGTDLSQCLISKQDSNGVIQWQRKLSGAHESVGWGVALDSSNNVYVTGSTIINSGEQGRILVLKYNNSGTLQWQRTLGSGTTTNEGRAIAVNAQGEVFIVGVSTVPGGSAIQLAKYNTSGTLQWQKTLGGGTSDGGAGIALDGDSNIYIAGSTFTSNVSFMQVAKYNTSGSLLWQKTLGPSADGVSISIDSAGNIYALGSSVISVFGIQLVKYNSSGVLQWQRRFSSAQASFAFSTEADSSGNVYIAGQALDGIYIAKLDTSGNVLWQRQLTGTGITTGSGLTADSENIYGVGLASISGANAASSIKLPNDGDGIGTYTINSRTVTYSAVTLTVEASSLTDSTSSRTDATSSLVGASSSLTSNTSTLAQALIEI